MTALAAPPLPEKSRLRKLGLSSPSLRASATQQAQSSPPEMTVTLSDTSPSPSVEAVRQIRSRFTEHFDHIPPFELLEQQSDADRQAAKLRRQRTVGKTLQPFLQASQSTPATDTNDATAVSPMASVSASHISSESSSRPMFGSTFLSFSSSLQRSQSSTYLKSSQRNDEHDATPSDDKETDKKPIKRYNEDENVPAPMESVPYSSSGKSARMVPLISFNRAEVIITRLDNWHHVLKAIGTWLEETAKIALQGSRGYYQRALPPVKEDLGGNGPNSDNPDAITTFQAGLQMLTMHLTAEQREFGKKIQHDFIPVINKLKKECKEMIRGLKEEPELVMDELLRLAESTRKCMSVLNKCCKAAEAALHSHQPVQEDPWLANLYVLRQLKREVDEENRLRELMVPIQKGTRAFEERVLEVLKSAISFCYQGLAPGKWDGSQDDETAPVKLLLDQIMPEKEWAIFYESHKKDLVNEDNPRKDYLNISYPNKLNPYVMTVAKGKMDRRTGVRKQFTTRYYILSRCGFLHQFALDEKVSPERSYYIPDTVVVPTLDINHLTNSTPLSMQHAGSHNPADGVDPKNLTIEIHRASTQVLQRDKSYFFRVPTREEYITWCRFLTEAANRPKSNGNGFTPPIQRPLHVAHRGSESSVSLAENDHHPAEVTRKPSTASSIRSIGSNKNDKNITRLLDATPLRKISSASLIEDTSPPKTPTAPSSSTTQPATSPSQQDAIQQRSPSPAAQEASQPVLSSQEAPVTNESTPSLRPPSDDETSTVSKETTDKRSLNTSSIQSTHTGEILIADTVETNKTPDTHATPKPSGAEQQEADTTPRSPVAEPQATDITPCSSVTEPQATDITPCSSVTEPQETDITPRSSVAAGKETVGSSAHPEKDGHTQGNVDHDNDDEDDAASIMTARPQKAPATVDSSRPLSLASTQFDDSESSVYFSSTSAPPSPTFSHDSFGHEVDHISIPALDFDAHHAPASSTVSSGGYTEHHH